MKNRQTKFACLTFLSIIAAFFANTCAALDAQRLAVSVAPAQAARPIAPLPAATHPQRQDLLGCLLAPSAEVELGSSVIGVLSKVLVERGDHVKKGQVVAQLVDDVERASVDAASQRADNRADVAAAKSAYEFAQSKSERAEELFAKNFISSQARDQAVSEAKVAAMHYAQTQEARIVAREDMGVAKAQLGLRTITSPFNGVVVDRYLSAGARVEEKPIVKLVQIDPLRVEVVATANRFNTIKTGSYASVTPDLAGMSEYRARVTQVDAVIDAASNTFRVRLELPNPGGAVPSGLRCKINFDAPELTGSN